MPPSLRAPAPEPGLVTIQNMMAEIRHKLSSIISESPALVEYLTGLMHDHCEDEMTAAIVGMLLCHKTVKDYVPSLPSMVAQYVADIVHDHAMDRTTPIEWLGHGEHEL